MNKEAINKTIAAIENCKHAEQICMGTFTHGMGSDAMCDTAACIGGWMVVANYSEAERKSWSNRTGDVADRATDILGAYEDGDIAGQLFFMDYVDRFALRTLVFSVLNRDPEYTSVLSSFDELPADIRKQSMLNVLHILHDTGRVEWIEAITLAIRKVRAMKGGVE